MVCRFMTVLFFVIGCAACCAAKAYDNFVILGPGDATPVRGVGTDAAFDSIEGINRLMETLKKRGFTGVIDRVDLYDYDYDRFIHYNPLGDDNPEHRHLHKCMLDVAKQFSQGKEVRIAAEKNGLEFWIWLPNVYSVGCPPAVEKLGLDLTNWGYEHTYSLEHRDQLVIDRNGKTQYGVLEYAYPGARQNMVNEIISFVNTTGAKNVIPCLRSEASQMQPPPQHADQYGFNPPIVEEMKKRYNVNILEDPRFDYKNPKFDIHDPMLENWRRLRGSYLTQFYRELREALNTIDPSIKVGVQLPGGDYIGPPLGNMRIEWEKWIDEGLVDLIIPNISLEATVEPEAYKKGYFTDAEAGQGIHPTSVWRKQIDQSKHPEIKLIQPHGNHLFFKNPDKGYDGWRTDFWHLSFNSAWPQRWMQWRKDIKEFGHIKYIVEDFDSMPARNKCWDGGWGGASYNPALRKSPGLWMHIGDGNDAKPFAQEEIREGSAGLAMKLTGASSVDRCLCAIRWTLRDRNWYLFRTDNALYNGKFTLEYSVFRPKNESSLTVAVVDKQLLKMDEVGIKIDSFGKVLYADNGKFVPSEVTLEIAKWQRFKFEADLESLTYSCFVDGENVCTKAIIKPANQAISPEYTELIFDPGTDSGTDVYIDNVALLWVPQLYDPQGEETVIFSEDFEKYTPRSKFKNSSSAKWNLKGGKGFFIENNTSYGLGVNCLRALGGGTIKNSFSLGKSDYIVADLNVFIRSDKEEWVYMTPPPGGLTSKNGVQISLTTASGDIFASVKAEPGGKWLVYDGGKYVPTDEAVQYDAWGTVRLVIDEKAKTYSFIMQLIGELPRKIYTAKYDTKITDKCNLVIAPSKNDGHITCYDNICVSSYKQK